VDVVGKDRTGEQNMSAEANCIGKAVGDGASLNAGENDGWVFQRRLGGGAKNEIM